MAKANRVHSTPRKTASKIQSKRHPIFGVMPKGFKLEQQSISMLEIWHRRAGELIAKLPENAPAEEFDRLASTELRIYRAILKARPKSSVDVARQMQAIRREAEGTGLKAIEKIISFREFQRLALNLDRVTQPIVPQKKIGPLSRGRRLTRAGVMQRYQSFLVKELLTIGCEIYGARDFALRGPMFEDDAVNRALRSRRHPMVPFFDPSKLSARAHAVLKSLKIDTEHSSR